MGLFTFLSRKSGNRGKSKTKLKPAVHGPVVSQWPRPKGGRAIGEKKPQAQEAPSPGRHEAEPPQDRLGSPSEDGQPAPAPGIPLYREESVERPSTAPDASWLSLAPLHASQGSKEDGTKRLAPLSLRLARPLTAASGLRPSSRGSMGTTTGVFRHSSGPSRAASITSTGTGAFKDILDAQSEIRPADFRARVRAAGAKDYGEDVAERNLGENGFDLDSLHVRAFYAQSGSGSDVQGSVSRSSSHAPLRSSSKPLGLGPRRDIARRRSVNTYTPGGSGKGMGDSATEYRSVSLGELAPPVPVPRIQGLDLAFSAIGSTCPVVPESTDTAPAPAIYTERVPRNSFDLSRKRVAAVKADRRPPSRSGPMAPAGTDSASSNRDAEDDLPPPMPPFRTRSVRGWSASSGAPTALSESTPTTPSITTTASLPRRPQSIHTASTSVLDLSTADASPSAGSKRPRAPSGRVSCGAPGRRAASTVDSESDSDFSSQSMPDGRSAREPGGKPHSNPRSAPTMTTTTTATTTSPRPPSAAMTTPLHATPPISQPVSAPDDRFNIDDCISTDDASIVAPTAGDTTTATDGDTDTSTDADTDTSMAASRPRPSLGPRTGKRRNHHHHHRRRRRRPHPTAEGEEDLLFKDAGYGRDGMQLPGLAESLSASPPPAVGFSHSLGRSVPSASSFPSLQPAPFAPTSVSAAAAAAAAAAAGIPLNPPVLLPRSSSLKAARGGSVRRGVVVVSDSAGGAGGHPLMSGGRNAPAAVSATPPSSSRGIKGGSGRMEYANDGDGMLPVRGAAAYRADLGHAAFAAGRSDEVKRAWQEEDRMRMGRYVLDTGLDGDGDSSDEWQEPLSGRRKKDLRGDVDEGGYEADYVKDEDGEGEEEEEEENIGDIQEQQLRHGAREKGKQKARVFVLSAIKGREEGDRGQEERHGGDGGDVFDVAAAVRLRREAKRARRLAGHISPASMRRTASGEQRTRPSMPVPVVRIDGPV